MGTPDETETAGAPEETEVASTSANDGAGTATPDGMNDGASSEDAPTTETDTAPDPGASAGPQPQDPNAARFQQGFSADGGGESSDEVRDGETLAMFADRHRIPVNAVREANADQVDANGNLLANVTRLVVPQ